MNGGLFSKYCKHNFVKHYKSQILQHSKEIGECYHLYQTKAVDLITAQFKVLGMTYKALYSSDPQTF